MSIARTHRTSLGVRHRNKNLLAPGLFQCWITHCITEINIEKAGRRLQRGEAGPASASSARRASRSLPCFSSRCASGGRRRPRGGPRWGGRSKREPPERGPTEQTCLKCANFQTFPPPKKMKDNVGALGPEIRFLTRFCGLQTQNHPKICLGGGFLGQSRFSENQIQRPSLGRYPFASL